MPSLLALPEFLSRFVPALEGDAAAIALWALAIGLMVGLGAGSLDDFGAADSESDEF